MRRKGSSSHQYTRRIPADVRAVCAGLKLTIPIGSEFTTVRLTERTPSIRVSLRTSEPAEVKTRQAAVDAYLERFWNALRQPDGVTLTHKQATALAGEVYRLWADSERRTATHSIEAGQPPRLNIPYEKNEQRERWEGLANQWEGIASESDIGVLEKRLGKYADVWLLKEGIPALTKPSRTMFLKALAEAVRDAFASRHRNAHGDYSADPKASRFPPWSPPHSAHKDAPQAEALQHTQCPTLTAIVEDWWKEARAAGKSISTYE